MKVGIIGCGAVAPKHALAYGRIQRDLLAASCDIVYVKLTEFYASRYAPSTMKLYPSHHDMLEAENLDLVSICTPSSTHAEIAIQCAEAGVNVLCEKPIDVDVAKAEKMIDAFENSDAKLSVIFQNRWHTQVERLRLEAYVKWEPIKASMTVNWYRPHSYFKGWKGILHLGGDIVLNQIVHHIDILRYIFGEVVSVFAYVHNTRPQVINSFDVCTAVLKFDGGLIATLDATTYCYPENERTELTIITDEGPIVIKPKGATHDQQIRHIIESLRDGKQPEVTGADALKSLKVALALHESAFTGREVSL